MTASLVLAIGLLAAPIAPPLGVGGQGPTDEPAAASRRLDDLSLEELLDLRTAVAARVERSLREVPGIVTIVTHEEIVDLGLRDLVDVLRLVPGLHLAIDNENFVGIGVRGVWGQEGKVLLLLDGQQMNEPFYDCLGLGSHFPVDQLARVEIIRGPGSVTYGGLAELAVINLVTRTADQIGPATVRATWGQSPSTWGRRTVSAQAAGASEGGRVTATVSAYAGQARRSDRTFVDFSGDSYPMASGARTDPLLVNASLEVDDLALRLIHDGYSVQARDGIGSVVPPVRAGMGGWFAEARWPAHLAPSLTLTPILQYRQQYPWQVRDTASPMYFDKTAEQWQASALASWKPADRMEVVAGASSALNRAWVGPAEVALLRGGRRTDRFWTASGFAEVLWDGWPANLSAGARYEHHEVVGGSLVPRLAVTRVFGPVHAKLLYAEAYRTPGFGNLALSTGIKPERTRVAEAEVGYRADDWLSASVNLFEIVIERPIVYMSDPVGNSEGYRNGDRTGSRGLEVEARFRLRESWWTLGYSFYTPAGLNRVEDYVVPGQPRLLRAFPGHKMTLTGRIAAGPLRVAPSLEVTSDRYAELRGDASGEPAVGNAGPTVLLGLNVTWRDAGWRGLDLSAGVHNALDRREDFLHPYPGHAPLPGSRREVSLQVAWSAARP